MECLKCKKNVSQDDLHRYYIDKIICVKCFTFLYMCECKKIISINSTYRHQKSQYHIIHVNFQNQLKRDKEKAKFLCVI